MFKNWWILPVPPIAISISLVAASQGVFLRSWVSSRLPDRAIKMGDDAHSVQHVQATSAALPE
ncbi:hypothetical protein [Ruegeria lacuscaerulensis]|uniref:hypothetical protein n=1 Tax=Ruegeria lacuscaerulensis TaxID=55218 RepID=UPI00147CE27B|nr:hypothetical protein [Ruegeria lacuscaerulensis]